MKHRMLSVLAAGWFGIGIAYAQPAKPTDEDVEQAIRVCWGGTKTDAQVEGGLNLLKQRILTGEGKLSQSQIPSVIGSQVQTDDAKIRLFLHIQQCVVDHVYSQAKRQGSAGQRPENTSESQEDKLWNSIIARNNKQEYELYLRKYPAGRFADIAKYRATHIDDAGFALSDNGQRICDFVHYNNSNPFASSGVQKCKLSNDEWISPPNNFDQSKLIPDHKRVLLYIFQTTKINKTDAARALGYTDQILDYYLDGLRDAGYIEYGDILKTTSSGRAYIVEHGLAQK